MFVAVLALMVSVYEGYEMRKHNRLSIKPYINSEIYMENTPNKNTFEITLKNPGLGPAIIEEFSIYANGKKVESRNQAMREIGINKFSRLHNLKKGHIISEGESLLLVRIDTILSKYNLKFTMKYKSLYEIISATELEF